MARPRKPTVLKVLQGTQRPDRANPAAPRSHPLASIPAPPERLSEAERAAWSELSGIVGPLQVTTAADMVAYEQMAVTLAIVNTARAAVNEHGQTYTVSTESGEVIRKRPEVEILIAFKRQLSAELARFGLTPAEREKVSGLGGEQKANPLAEFAQGAK